MGWHTRSSFNLASMVKNRSEDAVAQALVQAVQAH